MIRKELSSEAKEIRRIIKKAIEVLKVSLQDISNGTHCARSSIRKLLDNKYCMFDNLMAIIDFLYLEPDFRAGFALHLVGSLLTGKTVGRLPVDLQYLITALESVFLCRRVLIWLVDNDIPILIRLIDNSSDTSVGLCDHHLQVLVVLLGDVNGVRIQGSQHGVNPGSLDPVHRKGVDIGAVKLFQDGVLDLGPLPELETLRLREGDSAGEDSHSGRQDCFLDHILVDSNSNPQKY